MVLSYAVPSFFVIVQYYSFYAHPNEIKELWKHIRDSWSLLKNETERDIMRQYASIGELHTILLTLSVCVSIILYAFVELMPIILDIIFPLNETRPRKIHASIEYFIDERTYFYAILCHWYIGLCFGFFVLIATSTLEFVYYQHICGLLKIGSYRIEHSLDKYISCNFIPKKHDTVIQNISAAVKIHLRALKCSEFLKINFMITFFLIAIIFVLSISLNLFRLFQAIILQSVEELITSTGLLSVIFLFMFLIHYYGQTITDHNIEIFAKTYNVQWYMVPVKIQKLLLFIMQNTTKLYILNIGNLVGASIEDFMKLTSMSISYFTVMYSL
ncbi:uncharacterized protein [Anoplolepis gracilipes]